MAEKAINTISEFMILLQTELQVAKKRQNGYQNYCYRNAEDILAELKPYLKKYGAYLSIGHDLEEKAGKVFLKVILILRYKDSEIKNEYFCATETDLTLKKGQSLSQAFGSTISYANKYAMSSMFLLDDGIDDDLLNNGSLNTKQNSYYHAQNGQYVHN